MKSADQLSGSGFVSNLRIKWEKITLSMWVCLFAQSSSTSNITLKKDLPLEYNTWLLFRQAVDVILVK